MPFAGSCFNGRVSYDAFWHYEPGTFKPLCEPRRAAARWCGRCWRLIPNGAKAFAYDGHPYFDLCHPCHRAITADEIAPTKDKP